MIRQNPIFVWRSKSQTLTTASPTNISDVRHCGDSCYCLPNRIANAFDCSKALYQRHLWKSWIELLVFEIRGALRYLVSFVQFKKREKHPWRSVTFNKLKVSFLHRCCSRFLNCINGSKSCNASHNQSILPNKQICIGYKKLHQKSAFLIFDLRFR